MLHCATLEWRKYDCQSDFVWGLHVSEEVQYLFAECSTHAQSVEFLGAVKMVAVFKQVGTVSCESDKLKMSIITSTRLMVHVLICG